jgi:hypothetical protein
MEKLIRLMTNNRSLKEETNFVEEMTELTEFVGVALASLMVLTVMAML